MEAPTPPQIVAYTGENNSIFSIIPNAILPEIFKYLSLEQSLSAATVCQRWNDSIKDRINLRNAHPRVPYAGSGLTIGPRQFIGLVNHYEYKLKSLNLRMCPVTDDDLSALTAKFASLKLCMTPLVTDEGLIRLADKMISPLKLQIGCFTNIAITKLFAALAMRNIKLKKLNLSQCTQTISALTQNNPNIPADPSDELCKFIRQGGLVSPCRLDLSAEAWVDRNVINAIVESGVKLSYVNFTETSVNSDDLLYLITQGAVLPECEIILGDDIHANQLLNGAIVDQLIEKGIKLKSLNSKTVMHLSERHLRKLIMEGLHSKCSLSISSEVPAATLIDLIIESKIIIEDLEIHIDDQTMPQDFVEEFIKLLKNAQFSNGHRLSINQHTWAVNIAEVLQHSHQQVAAILDSLKNRNLKIGKLELTYLKGFTQSLFLDMCAYGILASKNLVLNLQNCGWDISKIIKALSQAQVSFEEFQISEENEHGEWDFELLLQNEAFAHAKSISLPQNTTNLSHILKNLSKNNLLSKLDCKLDAQSAEVLIELLRNKNSFKGLVLLNLSGVSKEYAVKLMSIRPNLTVLIKASDFQ